MRGGTYNVKGNNMTLPIKKASERDGLNGIKGAIFGKSGIGKTSLLWTLPPEETLFVDLEAGGLSVQGYGCDSMSPKTWEGLRDLACYIGGANPARSGQTYGKEHFDHCVSKFGDPAQMDKYKTVFIDSITEAGRICLAWSKKQPEAFSEKTGKPNMLGAYGLHGQEMVTWMKHLKHAQGKNIWLVGILDEKKDEFGRTYYDRQIDGQKASLEINGIFDFSLIMARVKDENDKTYRALICHEENPFGYPAKERGMGKIDMIEEPNLTKLMNKINGTTNNTKGN